MARNTTLTQELAARLEFYWQLAGGTLSDEQICEKIGISLPQLHGWLDRDQHPRLPDGTFGSEALRAIRARAKASTMIGYLMRLNRLADQAEASGDYRTAVVTLQWLLSRQFPEQYGERRPEQHQLPAGTTGVIRLPAPAPTTEEWLKRKQVECRQVPQLPQPSPEAASLSPSGNPTPAAKETS